MEREELTERDMPAEPHWIAVAALAAGIAALLGWAVTGAMGSGAMAIPPLAGGLIGWGAWRLGFSGRAGSVRVHATVRVRRLPPDLPREFS